MQFTKLDTYNCDCINGANPNNTQTFARKINEAKELKDRDFRCNYQKTNFERNSSKDCEDICSDYCISIDIWNEESQEVLLKKYNITSTFSPQIKAEKQLCIFKIKEDGGLVKHTPNQKHGINPFHYDLYKEDDFTIEKLELIELIPIE